MCVISNDYEKTMNHEMNVQIPQKLKNVFLVYFWPNRHSFGDIELKFCILS